MALLTIGVYSTIPFGRKDISYISGLLAMFNQFCKTNTYAFMPTLIRNPNRHNTLAYYSHRGIPYSIPLTWVVWAVEWTGHRMVSPCAAVSCHCTSYRRKSWDVTVGKESTNCRERKANEAWGKKQKHQIQGTYSLPLSYDFIAEISCGELPY